MLGSKRQANGTCPDRPDLKLIKDDALSVYESTFLKLCSNGPPRMARAIAESSGSHQDTHTCLCRPGKSAAPATKTDAASPNMTGVVSFRACSTSQKSPSISEDHGPLCFHCRRKTCARCWRQCAQCEEEFCSVCSILDFSERYDRAFCLDCYSSSQMASAK